MTYQVICGHGSGIYSTVVHEYKTTWTEVLKKVKNKERRVLHLQNLFNLHMQSDCSVVCLGYYLL